MKKLAITLMILAIAAVLFVSCNQTSTTSSSSSTAAAAAALKVGMVTDAGTIDDKSFNQGTWEGIVKAQADLKIESNYLKPSGSTEADYIKEIGNLYDTGYKFIVTPGFKFETAIFATQDKYADAKFVLIDGVPNNGKFDATREEKVGPNTVSIFFAEHESGFLAGVATALQLKEGAVGFIGGMEIPPVQKFNWGFQQGVAYANANLSTKVTIAAENVVYQGSFDNVAAGGQLAAQFFERGVKAIFAAAGGVGIGAINEAKTRTQAGTPVWVIGVDSDQYNVGVYEGEKSVILTSALKRVDQAAYDMIKAQLDGKFPGGQTIVMDAKNGGVSIPASNPNLSAEVQTKVGEVTEMLKKGEITVSAVQGDLIK